MGGGSPLYPLVRLVLWVCVWGVVKLHFPPHMRRGTFITASVLTSWIIPMASFAAVSGDTEQPLWERANILRTSLETRIPESAGTLVPDAAKKKAWDGERKRHAERAADLRKKCRDEIRKANRDTIVAKSEQCFRGDLLEELTLHRKEQIYVASLPGIDAKVQTAFQDALKKLIDAEVAIVNGVDTGVYASVELLQSAKRKLRDQYRIPYRTALFRLHADRQIPWLAWHVDRLEKLLSEAPETPAETTLKPAARAQWTWSAISAGWSPQASE